MTRPDPTRPTNGCTCAEYTRELAPLVCTRVTRGLVAHQRDARVLLCGVSLQRCADKARLCRCLTSVLRCLACRNTPLFLYCDVCTKASQCMR